MSSSTFNSDVRPSPHAASPKAAALAVAFVIVSEVAFLSVSEPLTGAPFLQPTADDATVSVKHGMLDTAGKFDIIAVGDSSCLMGVKPDIVRENTECEVLNLGTLSSLTMAGFCSMGKEALHREHRPKAVLVVVLPRAFEVTEAQARQFDQIGRYSIAYGQEVPGYDLSVEERASWFYRKHRLNRFPDEFGGSLGEFKKRLIDRRGYWAESGSYAGGAALRDEFKESTWAVNQLRSLIREAGNGRTHVLLWFSPVPTDCCSEQYAEDGFQALAVLESELSFSFSMLQDRIPRWPIERFATESHLKEEYATVNSMDLSYALSAHFKAVQVGR